MARINLRVLGDPRAGDTYFVSVKGPLARRDLKRLETLCDKALEHRTPLLEVRLTDATAIDSDARAFVERLRARGAIIVDKRPRRALSDGHRRRTHQRTERSPSTIAHTK